MVKFYRRYFMGFFSKNKADFSFSITSYNLSVTHIRGLLGKSIPFALNQLGYVNTTVDISSNEDFSKWLGDSVHDYNPHWDFRPTGYIDMKITSGPSRCQVSLVFPDLNNTD